MTGNGGATGNEGTNAAMSTSTVMSTTDATSGADTPTTGGFAQQLVPTQQFPRKSAVGGSNRRASKKNNDIRVVEIV